MDHLRSELLVSNLLDIIDSEIEKPNNYNENLHNKRKELVRNIIFSHLDDHV